jgi:DNA-binding HxlR family transcriptional regulator
MIKPKKSKVDPPPPGCPLEEVLSFLAGAWTPKILWYLRAEPRRFGDLKRDLGRISAKVMTTRLRELESRGIVTRTVMPTSPPTVEYALTEFGMRFQPVLETIAEVGIELHQRSGKAAKPCRSDKAEKTSEKISDNSLTKVDKAIEEEKVAAGF